MTPSSPTSAVHIDEVQVRAVLGALMVTVP